MKHRETHPNLDVDGCFGCKIAHVAVSSSATPNRRRDTHQINEKEKRWDTDMAAYKRLRQDGLQPPKIDGAANIEKKAETKFQVESGYV
jgi:hypothetical protein